MTGKSAKRGATRRLAFKRWIEKTGSTEVAKLLGIRRETVHHWRAGHCYPRVEQMKAIKRLTKGLIGYDEMIESHIQVGGAK